MLVQLVKELIVVVTQEVTFGQLNRVSHSERDQCQNSTGVKWCDVTNGRKACR